MTTNQTASHTRPQVCSVCNPTNTCLGQMRFDSKVPCMGVWSTNGSNHDQRYPEDRIHIFIIEGLFMSCIRLVQNITYDINVYLLKKICPTSFLLLLCCDLQLMCFHGDGLLWLSSQVLLLLMLLLLLGLLLVGSDNMA